LLFDLWFDVPHRPTRDADFLGFGPADINALASTVREICNVAVDDGMAFDPESMTIEEIREDARYGGLRAAWSPGLAMPAAPCSSTSAMAQPARAWIFRSQSRCRLGDGLIRLAWPACSAACDSGGRQHRAIG
jgi:hypothetical protein